MPFDTGTVITYNTHTVTGRNYATGDAVWTYTRTDASICTVFQQTGITVAIFTDPDGFCDEIDGFKTGTGARDWYRTLDSNGNTLYTRPVITASPFTVLISAPNYLQAVDPVSAIDRWTFTQPKGCTTTSSVMGTGGVLISQHCGNGDHLILRDAYAGNEDNNASAGAKWNVLSDAIPLSADSVITALDPASGRLLVYSSADGKVSGTQTLTPTPTMSPAPTVSVVSGNNSVLATIGDSTYSLDMNTGRQLWTSTLVGPATLATANPLAITAAGIVELDPQTGKVTATYPITAPPAGSSAVQARHRLRRRRLIDDGVPLSEPPDIVGRWTIERSLHDRALDLRGSFTGMLTVEPDELGLRWHETGTLTWDGRQLAAERTLAVRPVDGRWWMTFADGGLFHPWVIGEPVIHPCAADIYRGLIERCGPSRPAHHLGCHRPDQGPADREPASPRRSAARRIASCRLHGARCRCRRRTSRSAAARPRPDGHISAGRPTASLCRRIRRSPDW